MLTTAEYPWGCGCGWVSWAAVVVWACLIPAPIILGEEDKGICTGMQILACMCWARINGKVRTKSFVLGGSARLGVFSAMLWFKLQGQV